MHSYAVCLRLWLLRTAEGQKPSWAGCAQEGINQVRTLAVVVGCCERMCHGMLARLSSCIGVGRVVVVHKLVHKDSILLGRAADVTC